MSLLVSIAKDGTTYNLRCEQITHSFTRAPTQSGLPGENSGDPNVLLLDLGVCIQQISVRGLVNVTSDGSGDPTKSELDTVVKRWYESSATPATMMQISTPSSGSYYGVVRSASFTMLAGTETYWSFEITFLLA